MYSVTWR